MLWFALLLAQDPVIRVKTQLVQINAVVSNGEGPVHGLTKADFQLTAGGRVREIALFSEDTKVPGGRAETLQLPSQVFSNLPTGKEVPRNVSVVLFDTLNSQIGHAVYAKQQLVKFLRSVPEGERVAIYLLAERLVVLHDFTSDPKRLLAVAEAMDGRRGSSTNKTHFTYVRTGDEMLDRAINLGEVRQAIRADNDRMTVTIASFRQIAKHLKNFPGRKNLIWITAGIPFRSDFRLEIGSVSRELTLANVSIYPVDLRGPLPLRQEMGTSARMDGWDGNSLTMQAWAEQTGGLAIANTNDIAGAVGRVLKDAASSYTIGFYLSPEEADGKFHDVKLRVLNRSGVKVRTRSGYYAAREEEPTEARRLREVEVAMASPLDSLGIQVGGRAGAFVENGVALIGIRMLVNPYQVRFDRTADNKWEAHVDVIAELQSADGKRLVRTVTEGKLSLNDADRELLFKQGLEVPFTLPNDKNAAVLRVGVFDRKSGLAGTATRGWPPVP